MLNLFHVPMIYFALLQEDLIVVGTSFSLKCISLVLLGIGI